MGEQKIMEEKNIMEEQKIVEKIIEEKIIEGKMDIEEDMFKEKDTILENNKTIDEFIQEVKVREKKFTKEGQEFFYESAEIASSTSEVELTEVGESEEAIKNLRKDALKLRAGVYYESLNYE